MNCSYSIEARCSSCCSFKPSFGMGWVHNVISLLFLLFFAPSSPSLSKWHHPPCSVTPPAILCTEWLFRTFSLSFSLRSIFPEPQLFCRVIISGVNAAESSEATGALYYLDPKKKKKSQWTRPGNAAFSLPRRFRCWTESAGRACRDVQKQKASPGMFVLRQSLVWERLLITMMFSPLSLSQVNCTVLIMRKLMTHDTVVIWYCRVCLKKTDWQMYSFKQFQLFLTAVVIIVEERTDMINIRSR